MVFLTIFFMKNPTITNKESEMHPKPVAQDKLEAEDLKLQNKVAIITGGDSGIGRAVAIAYAKEGADSVIVYLTEDSDAEETVRLVEEHGRKCLKIKGDIGEEELSEEIVKQTIDRFGRIDILVNNAAEQHPQKNIEQITSEQLLRTFKTNIFSFFYLTQAAMPHLKEGAAIINTTSVTAYRGSPELLDYSATKGAIVAFTRSLSQALADKKIRVNAVAPGPVWTPLITASFDKEKVESFGKDQPLYGRPAEPAEIAPCYVFLAAKDSVYMTGQVLHPNGGEVVNT